MKFFAKTLSVLILSISFFSFTYAATNRAQNGFRYPRTFKAYIQEKYKADPKPIGTCTRYMGNWSAGKGRC